jgi:D-aminoacyl-tRNA deacylase
MIALIQRVSRAEVSVEARITGAIDAGILALIGIKRGDDSNSANRLLERILTYRIFPDAEGKMNLSLRDIRGGLLLVPQFTLAADTKRGTRAGFSAAAPQEQAQHLFDYMVDRARAAHSLTATGEFGAYMHVSLTNDGPVTFWLE